ncbi:hypothetical protein PV08_00366 [Exophiala spinifera]|uniref:G domain-containing protein n=1 Tax=Exophiala spinifera TaxID=91928 RepID=A0A0D1YWV2_9EURO|nr:uncharacterized protein PV08_00366 [Exophiala spinifera]KIW19791.1 hypothetical protein PV08_00366 [Exophiala spinifera]
MAHRDRVFIAVLGLTGSGKSTFINRCVGSDVARAGSDLSSITQKPEVYTLRHRGVSIELIDTPGFDDTNISDVDRLQELALYLTSMYKQKTNLTAIIYLHDIRSERVGGVALKNIHILQDLTGIDNFNAITVATNFWTDPPAERSLEHERILKSEPKFFGAMIQANAEYWRLQMTESDGRSDCLALIDQVTRHKLPVSALSIQYELVDLGLPFIETQAGRRVYQELLESNKESLEKIKELETRLNETLHQLEARRGSLVGDVFRWLGNVADTVCVIM